MNLPNILPRLNVPDILPRLNVPDILSRLGRIRLFGPPPEDAPDADPAAEPVAPLKDALSHCRRAVADVAGYGFLINLLVLTSPIYMMQVFDRVLSSGHQETLLMLTIMAGIAIAVMGLLETVRTRILARIGIWFERRLSPDLVMLSLDRALMGASAGAQPLRDLATIRRFLSSPALTAVLDMPWVPLFVFILTVLHPWLGLIGLIAALGLFAYAVLNEYLSRVPQADASRRSIENARRVEVALRNADAVQAMGMVGPFLKDWMARHRAMTERQLAVADCGASMGGASKFLRLFVQIVILGLGAYLVLRSELTPGGMIAGSILLGRALAPVEQSISGWSNFIAARDSYERVAQLLKDQEVARESMPLPAPEGRLACEDVWYMAQGAERPALAAVNFKLDAGETLGVIGPSGAGKSTLCKTIVGTIRPTRGHARLDGADIFDWPSVELGPHIGYLPQDVELFPGSVRANIARLDPDVEPEAIIEAARDAGVHEFILSLTDGYETEIGEGGARLSGGQRQRIGLARALCGKPKLIVLDEPNANLDGEGEAGLVRALAKAREWGATLILVSHRTSLLQIADKILFLKGARVEAFGTPEEVMPRLRPVQAETAGDEVDFEEDREVAVATHALLTPRPVEAPRPLEAAKPAEAPRPLEAARAVPTAAGRSHG